MNTNTIFKMGTDVQIAKDRKQTSSNYLELSFNDESKQHFLENRLNFSIWDGKS